MQLSNPQRKAFAAHDPRHINSSFTSFGRAKRLSSGRGQLQWRSPIAGWFTWKILIWNAIYKWMIKWDTPILGNLHIKSACCWSNVRAHSVDGCTPRWFHLFPCQSCSNFCSPPKMNNLVSTDRRLELPSMHVRYGLCVNDRVKPLHVCPAVPKK